MLVAVYVPMNGTLKQVLRRAAHTIREAKGRIPADLRDIAVYGPRRGFYRGNLVMLEYRITDAPAAKAPESLWTRKPDISGGDNASIVWAER